MAGETSKFLEAWGCSQRLSSAYYPHSNTRAELGVKSAKRLLRENTGPDGSLVRDRFFRALLQHRNTPDPDTGRSPAQVLFGRPVKDFMPIMPGKFKPQEGWRLVQEDREKALRVRYCRGKEKWSEHTKELPKLSAGDRVLIQNQWGTPKMARRWDRSGVVLEVENHDQYRVRVDGSGRITVRNRRFLRKVTPYQPQQPVHRAQIPTEPEEELRQPGPQQVPVDGAVDRVARKEQTAPVMDVVDTGTEVVQEDIVDNGPNGHCGGREAPGDTTGVVEEVYPTQEVRRSGRVRKPNVKLDPDTWDLGCVQCGKGR